MADFLQTSLTWLQGQAKAYFSRSVTYTRGSDEVVVSATVGQGKLFKLEEDYSAIKMEWSDRDYFIAAADLVLNGVVVLPVKGDQIIDSTDGTDAIYEVLAPGGEKPYRKVASREVMHQIHTKFMGTEP